MAVQLRVLRHRLLFDREDRLARFGILEVGEAVLVGLDYPFDLLAADFNIDHGWQGRGIVIPDVVVDQLIAPGEFPGLVVQRQRRHGPQIRAFAGSPAGVTAVLAAADAAAAGVRGLVVDISPSWDRHVGAFHVVAPPCSHSLSHSLHGRAGRPGFMPEFAGSRDVVVLPDAAPRSWR